MGFYSKSSRENHYKSGRHGSGHYQKKGLFGNLLDMFDSRSGSGSRRDYYENNHGRPFPMQNQPQENSPSIKCGKCNSTIPAGSKFCLQCGEKVDEVLFCINCGQKLPAHAKFCHSCGTKLNG